MPQYDNDMSGVLFKHDKEGNSSRPDYKGNCEIDGVEMWISAWIKTPKAGGAKFMSLSFEPKEGQVLHGASPSAEVPVYTSDFGPTHPADEDIPFHHDEFELAAEPFGGHANR